MGTRLTVAVMAGGTGGHVFPALAVAQVLRDRGLEVFWIGTRAGLEARLVPERGIPIEWIGIEGVRGKRLGQRLRAPARLATALFQALAILRRRRPALVLGMGGFVSGPGGLAARLLGLPLVIHEQNAIPGLTNRWLAPLATRVCAAVPDSFPKTRGALVTGNPVRSEIRALPAPAVRLAGRQGVPRLLVLGGSLGAQALNERLPPALAALPPERRPEVRHQSGERTLDAARAAYRAVGVAAEVTPFIADMAAAYAWADLAVCRAGALTVAELAAAGLGAILVPYPHAVDDHQTANARYLAAAGAARLVPQDALSVPGLTALLSELLGARARLLTMAASARALSRPAAADAIATLCQELAHR